MYLALFLHIYQPPTQFKSVLKRITFESYLKIVQILQKNPNAKITLNIPASLTEQLAANSAQIIEKLSELARAGQIEFTGTAAYHPLLPKLPKAEIIRQIELNHKINKKYFGKAFAPVGFFPPEMAYSEKVGDVVEKMGFSWIILEEYAYTDRYIPRNKIFKRQGGNLKVFFRERDLSLKIAFAEINSISKFEKYLGTEFEKDGYLITAMDGETFGHHRPGLEKFLAQLLNFKPLATITISEIFAKFAKVERITPRESSWGISEAECSLGQVYPRWDLPGNPLHKLQWNLTNLAIKSVNRKPEYGNRKKFSKARNLLDKALHSDQYWWASHNPYWHYKMVLAGANMLRDVVLRSDAPEKDKLEAKKLREKIASLGLALYGDRVIDF